MTERKRLNDVIPEWITSGIFAALSTHDVPWNSETDDITASLDLEYHGNHAGDKFVSPLVNKIMTGETLSASEIATLAETIYNLYSVNWSKLWNTLSFEYDPIENYSMTETMADDITEFEHGHTHKKTGTETQKPDLTNDTDSKIYGFNSSTGVPTGSNTATATGTNETEYDTTDADTGTDTNTRNYTLTRTGNIGVTTSQQMIQSERDLWRWNYFHDVIFPDLDRILTINIY